MRNKAVVLLLLLGAACGGGGTLSTPTSPSPAPTIPISSACTAFQTGSASTAVVNGVECPTATLSVGLLNMKDSSGLQVGSCSGTVLAARPILPAAHCLPAAAAPIKVFPGTGPEHAARSS